MSTLNLNILGIYKLGYHDISFLNLQEHYLHGKILLIIKDVNILLLKKTKYPMSIGLKVINNIIEAYYTKVNKRSRI